MYCTSTSGENSCVSCVNLLVFVYVFCCLLVCLFGPNPFIGRCNDAGEEDWLDLGILRTTWQCGGEPKVEYLGILGFEYSVILV